MLQRILKTFILVFVHLYVITTVAENMGLPHCVDSSTPGLLIVSTLDGKLSALNSSGNIQWQIDTGPGSLLKSNIHNIELTSNGEWIRLIPSLTGSLYKFNGKTLDPIPITADSLLKSSLMYSYDLVIAGGKEVRTYGIGLHSGNILYTCSLLGCQNETNFEGEIDNVLVIERNTLTVRAHEPRTGSERWNFSVGHHNLKMSSISCIHTDNFILNFNISAILPEGLLIATKLNDKNERLWSYKFDAPIVNVWLWNGLDLISVDVFDIPIGDKSKNELSPAIYLAMHNKQLYIHESNKMLNLVQSTLYANSEVTESKSITKIPWKPIPASTAMIKTSDHDVSAAHSVLYNSEYVNGNGYYLYVDKEIEAKDNLVCSHNSTINKYKIGAFATIWSLYHNWPLLSLLVITIATVYLIFRPRMIIVLTKTSSSSSIPTDGSYLTVSGSSGDIEEKFKSNYEDNFETVSRLGKGGFGDVFEAKLKIDECVYAIKRIALPLKSSEDQVLREVKALAKLDHKNIVRYYTSWFERPPNGWTYECDKKFPSDEDDQYYSSSGVRSTCEKKHTRNNSTVITIPYASNTEDDLLLRHDESMSDFDVSFRDDSKSSQGNKSEPNLSKYESREESSKSDSHSSRYYDRNRKSDVTRVYLYIQMQLCKKDSLQEWLFNNLTRNRDTIIPMYKQILDAVEYIHSSGLIHRDLKPSNIFFSLNNEIKVGDFGLVTTMNSSNEDSSNAIFTLLQSHTEGAGTQLYMSPEQLQRKRYNLKVDIYSLGVILFELLVPFKTETERRLTLEGLRQHAYPPNFKDQFPDEHKLLEKMLSVNPDVRPLTADIKKTPPFTPKC